MDVSLREGKDIEKFLRILQFFKKMKEGDIKRFDQEINQGEDTGENHCEYLINKNFLKQSNIVYLPKYYLNISKIH